MNRMIKVLLSCLLLLFAMTASVYALPVPEDMVWEAEAAEIASFDEEILAAEITEIAQAQNLPGAAPEEAASVTDGEKEKEGLKVRFNHVWLELPENEPSVTYDLTEYGAQSGQITLSANAEGDLYEVEIDSVKISSCEPDYYEEDPAVLLIRSRTPGDYKVTFKGENDLMFQEEPTRDNDPGMDSLLVVTSGGSRVELCGEDNASLQVYGLNVQEYRDGATVPTEFVFSDLTIRSRTHSSYALMAYGTQIRFCHCDIETRTVDNEQCFILGIGNEGFEDDMFRVEFHDTRLYSENLFADTYRTALGYPAPSAFNVSHSEVVLDNCDVDLHLPYIPNGECRGVYMLHGGLTVDGGTLDIVVGDEPVITDALEYSCGIQAVYVNIQNHAKVDVKALLDPEKYTDPLHICSTWGIIYATNIVIEDSDVSITADGSNAQGLYYFGKSTLSEETDLPDARSYHDYGDVIIRDSDVSIRTVGTAMGYVNTGISARHLYIDYPEGSRKKTEIEVNDTEDCCLVTAIYDFDHTGNVDLMNAAKILSPDNAKLVLTEYPEYYAQTGFYTFADPSLTDSDLKKAAIHHLVLGAAPKHDEPSYEPAEDAKLFTGTWNAPVIGGRWSMDAEGYWYFATDRPFRNTWGYITFDLPSGGNKTGWFYFDGSGKMLTGWQLIGGKWYYLNPVHDGTCGICYLSTITPDGYAVDENGAWIEER